MPEPLAIEVVQCIDQVVDLRGLYSLQLYMPHLFQQLAPVEQLEPAVAAELDQVVGELPAGVDGVGFLMRDLAQHAQRRKL